MATTWTFSDEEISTTSLNYLINDRKMQDRPRFFANDLISHKKEDGEGHTVVIPWDVQRHSESTRMITGYEAVNMTVQTVMKAGRDDWAYVVSPVVWSIRDEKQNSGKAKKIGILEKRTRDTDLRMLHELETRVLSASGASWADLNTINGFDSTTGFLEAGSSQTNTVHEISKGTYSSLVGFNNQRGDVGGAASTNLLDEMRLMQLRIKDATEDPTKLGCYASILGANQYNKIVGGNERYTGDDRDGARTKVLAGGMLHTVTSALPNAGTTTTNDPWSFLTVDYGAIELHTMPNMCMSLTPFSEISGYRVKAAFMEFFGQVTINYFASSGVIYDSEA
jgi:hypothetical protein